VLARLFYSRTFTPTCGGGQELHALAQIASQKSSESSFEHSEQTVGGWRSAQMHDIEIFSVKIRGYMRIWQAFRHSCSNKKSAIIKNW
jgi:hypothetical protein